MKALLSRRFAANHQELGKKKRTSGTQGKTNVIYLPNKVNKV